MAAEFGSVLTAHMITATWSDDDGWSEPTPTPRGALPLDAAALGLHYGQAVFEGLKAHRRHDGGISIFRPHAYARRMRNSAARLAMPQPPEELFLNAVSQLVRLDGDALPDDPALSLYLRPLLIASEPVLALRPAREYLFVVLAFVTGGFFAGGAPISVWVSTDHVRAAPGGAGAAKWPGNYAPTFVAQAEAQRRGCQQVVWLDAVERRWVEEMGGMNMFFVRDSGELTTPPLTGTILPGVTRDSILELGADLGHPVVEKPISLAEWRQDCRSGAITETIACGTAAIVTSVGHVRTAQDEWTIGNGDSPVAAELRGAIRELHRGLAPDPRGWLYPVT